MDQSLIANLPPPRFEDGKRLLVAGVGERYTCETSAGIPAQWQRFVPYLGEVPGQIGRVAYGVRYNFDDSGNFDYLCGVEVEDFSNLPPQWARVRLAQRRYAVFSHREHVSTIRRTWNTIWNKWLPGSDVRDRGCAGLRALRRTVQSDDGHGRGRGLGPDRDQHQRLTATGVARGCQPGSRVVCASTMPPNKSLRCDEMDFPRASELGVLRSTAHNLSVAFHATGPRLGVRLRGRCSLHPSRQAERSCSVADCACRAVV